MTDREALQEARRRWGNIKGGVRGPNYSNHRNYEVGKSSKAGFVVLGEGLNWEAAFTDADKLGRVA